jgi:hypothetical protein
MITRTLSRAIDDIRASCLSSVRRHTLAVGHRLDERVTVPEEYDFPANQRLPSSSLLVLN